MTDEMRRGVCPGCGTRNVLVIYRVAEDGPTGGSELPVGALCTNPKCRCYDPHAEGPAEREGAS
jgi:hypothetical protein